MKKISIFLLCISLMLMGCSKPKPADVTPPAEDVQAEVVEPAVEPAVEPTVEEPANEDIPEDEPDYDSSKLLIIVTAQLTDIHDGPSSETIVVGDAQEEMIFEVEESSIDTEGVEWFKVIGDDLEGWISSLGAIPFDLYDPIFKTAYRGQLDNIPFGVGTDASDIVASIGAPEVSDYFMGGYYLSYSDKVFLTNGNVNEEGAINWGQVSYVVYTGTDPVFGIKNGMTIDQMAAVIGEPDAIDDFKGREGGSELYGQNIVATYYLGNYALEMVTVSLTDPIQSIIIHTSLAAQ